MTRTILTTYLLLSLCSVSAQVQKENYRGLNNLYIENDKVSKYMDEVQYDFYSESVMSQYIGTRQLQDEHPRSIAIDLSILQEGKEYQLTCYESLNIILTAMVKASDVEYVITNLLPGKRYMYHISDLETAATMRHGAILTDGKVRMIEFPHLYNTRDLGGWETIDGRRIKYGMLYRGVELHAGKQNTAPQETLDGLKKLGINAELDMRRTYPQAQYGDFADNTIPTESAWGPDMPYLCVNMTSIESMLSSYPSKFRDALNFIIQNLKEGRTVYYHCVWGADRTGTLSALMEAMLGVSLSDIYKEYELTSFSAYSSTRDKASLNTRLLNVVGYSAGGTKTLQECAIDYAVNRLGIKREDITAMQDILLESHGDVPTGIGGEVSDHQDSGTTQYYTTSGMKRSILQHGINIVADGNGSIKKLMVK